MRALVLGSKAASRVSSKLLAPSGCMVSSERTKYWHYLWKPEPRPPTSPEEHAASAKKYGLLPQDYKPISRDGISTDYPDVPLVSPEARDPYYNWDNPEYKRDFGEPMHEDWEMYTEDRVNANMNLRISPTKMLAAFLGAIAGYTLIFLYFNDKKMFQPAMPKQYARDGVHYSFQLKE